MMIGLKTYIAAIGAAILGLILAFVKGKSAGKQGAELKQAKSEVKAHETRNQVERDIDRGDAVSELRTKWGRK